MIADITIVSLAGGLLCLDRVFVQTLLSRPIAAGPLIGICLGDSYTGLIAGAFIELFWIDRLPIGAYIPPNDTIAAVLIAAGAIESGRLLGHLQPGLIATAVLIFVPVALIAQKMEVLIVLSNENLAKEALKEALNGNLRAIDRKHLLALIRAWMLATGMILVSLPLGILAMTWGYPHLPPSIHRGLQLFYSLIPLIGTAVALNAVNLRGRVPLLCALFLAMTVLLNYFRSV
jgi:PTS system mannose-specific IIC component